MSGRGYTTPGLVADELGRTLTAAQNTQCDGLIEEAESFVDRYTGRAWLVTSPVTDELHVLTGPVVYLKEAPVIAVSAVSVRSGAIGATWTALVGGTGFELIDPTNGVLALSSYPLSDPVVNGPAYAPGTLVKATYTFTSPLPVPKDIQRATTLLVARWMLPRLDPASAGLETVSLAQGDIAVKYRDLQGAEKSVPDTVTRILNGWRGLVFA